jgi:stage V sporulation protein G
MEITEVRVFPVNEDKLKAYATITFDDCFVVRDLKVIHGNSGLFVAMPSKKRKDGTFKDVAHPLNNEFRSKIEQKVLDAYEAERAAAAPGKTGSPAPGSAAEGGPAA